MLLPHERKVKKKTSSNCEQSSERRVAFGFVGTATNKQTVWEGFREGGVGKRDLLLFLSVFQEMVCKLLLDALCFLSV